MKVLYDECIDALRDNKCSECNEFYQCSVCDYFQQRYEQGRADKERELPELPNEYSEKLWKIAYDRGYQQGRADAIKELPTSLYCDGFNEGYAKGKTDAIDELKPFFEESSQYVFDWICDDICGEFINPKTDESWCAEHCNNGTRYECIKKWCEWKRLKEQKNV